MHSDSEPTARIAGIGSTRPTTSTPALPDAIPSVRSSDHCPSTAVRNPVAGALIHDDGATHVIDGDRLKAGTGLDDGAALRFEQAVAPEARRLFGLAMTIVRDRADAEDAVQETFFSAWRSWSKLRDEAHLSAWLSRICVRHCLRRRRHTIRQLLWVSDEASAMYPRTQARPFDGRLLDFDRAFRQLSRSQRAVFTLHVHHGFTLNECADMMGCRPGTARSHLGRAVARLRKELNDA
jgi:RNA polymerase sigma-70 factor (ECF subfamily)